jgi:uncharacterized protein (TIGR00288 family)
MPTPASPTDSIALLIDADNAPAARIDFIIAELATYGVVNIRRAYGNWQKPELSGWQKVLHDYASQPIQHFDLVKGKNAADMALLIEAMDILYTKNVGTFCLVSSDCDFTPLVLRLRSDGKQVIGFGGKNAFSLPRRSSHPAQTQRSKPTADQLKQDAKLIKMLRRAIEAQADADGWAFLGGVGSHISNQGSFDSRNYGFPKLGDLVAAIDLCELKKTQGANGTSVQVRLRD